MFKSAVLMIAASFLAGCSSSPTEREPASVNRQIAILKVVRTCAGSTVGLAEERVKNEKLVQDYFGDMSALFENCVLPSLRQQGMRLKFTPRDYMEHKQLDLVSFSIELDRRLGR